MTESKTSELAKVIECEVIPQDQADLIINKFRGFLDKALSMKEEAKKIIEQVKELLSKISVYIIGNTKKI